jgi:hypothetical protein
LIEVLAGLGLLDHLLACRAHGMDLGAHTRNAPVPSFCCPCALQCSRVRSATLPGSAAHTDSMA